MERGGKGGWVKFDFGKRGENREQLKIKLRCREMDGCKPSEKLVINKDSTSGRIYDSIPDSSDCISSFIDGDEEIQS